MGLPDRRRRTLLHAGTALSALVLLAGRAGRARASERRSPAVWDDFRRRFVADDGRVVDDDGSTHSEGLGTALIASTAAGDRDAFDRIWAFARGLRREDGLFSWRVQRGGRVVDANNATDGDLYIAWALSRAATTFGQPEYAQEARRTARAVRAHCVRESRRGPVLVPGRYGFDRGGYVVANPSYWVFPAFQALHAIDPHPLWKALADTALGLLATARFGPRQLAADWIEIAEDIRPWRERPARFGYEAIRVPLFLYWGHQLTHPQVVAFTRYAAAPAFPAWVALDHDEQSRERAPAGFEAVARLVRGLPNLHRVQAPPLNHNYYSSSLSLLAVIANEDLLERDRVQRDALGVEPGAAKRRVAAD